MALVLADRVQETSTSTGTGSFTLAGAVTGYQTFAVIGNGNTCYYTIADQGGANWEVGIGTYSTTGPTLARTTVLSNSDGNTSPVDFPAGTKTVFVTYPSEKSVNLDSSGNVSALGTVSSGTWQGSTVGVAYGGTGVTSSSGANSVVLRDANANVTFNNFTASATAVTAAAGTTILTVASARTQILVGSTTQTFQLPDATTLVLGQSFLFINNSSGTLTVTNNASATIETIPSGGITQIGALSIATSAGSWGIYSFLPGAYNFNNSSADFGGATISNAVWNGTTIASGYGGTGLTTFTGANNALYSTSSSALTAGTLPVPAGGTGQTSFTSGYIPYGDSSAALQSSNLLQFNGSYLQVGGGSVLGGATNPIAAFTQSANNFVQTYIYNTDTGTSASSDFVTYADNSTDTEGFADMGFTSSTYDDAFYTVTGPNEAYLFGSAPGGSGASGNLVYATDSTGSDNAHQWYVGGFTQAKSAYKMQLDNNYLELKTPVYVDGSTGTSGQVLTSAGSGAAPTWTTPVTGGGTVTTTDFTATSGQTVFTVNYTVGSTEVYQNGAKLGIADFTATNGTSITLATGATAGDLIEVVTFSVLNLYSTITSETFNGTGSQTVFTMSAVPANTASLLVAISGVVQDPTTYTVSSNTLTFSTAPPSASGNISVRYLGIASVGTVGSFSGGTTGLTPASATTGAVVLGGTLATTNGGTGLTTVGTNGQVLTSNGTTLSYQTPAAATTFQTSLSGLTPSTATSGTVTLAGTLGAASGGTGLTSPGTSGNVLTSNGSAWLSSAPAAGGVPGASGEIFTSSGTFTIPTGVTKLKVTVVGGGGGGGSAQFSGGGGGGGGGGVAVQYFSSLTPGGTLAVTIGAAGSSNGGTGGTSSIASGTQSITTLSASGGSGGASANASSGSGGNGGSSFANAAFSVVGGRGGDGYGDVSTGGGGGAAGGGGGVYGGGSASAVGGGGSFGSGGASGSAGNGGSVGTGYGSGGGGAGNPGTPAANGAAGKAGIVMVEW